MGVMVTDSFAPPGLSDSAAPASAPTVPAGYREVTVGEAIGIGVRGLIDQVLHGAPIMITRKRQPLIELRPADFGCSCDRSTLKTDRHS
jgi:hypothetical protein